MRALELCDVRAGSVARSSVHVGTRAARRPERHDDGGGTLGHGLAVNTRGVGSFRAAYSHVHAGRDADQPEKEHPVEPRRPATVNEDFRDLLAALVEAGVRFLVVGAHAMAVHGVPRATGDLDIWIERSEANASRVLEALARFGAPVASLGLSIADFTRDDHVVQIGVPPRRIDFLTSISGVEFDQAWGAAIQQDVSGVMVRFLGREALVQNKRASGRAKDLADLEALGEASAAQPWRSRGRFL